MKDELKALLDLSHSLLISSPMSVVFATYLGFKSYNKISFDCLGGVCGCTPTYSFDNFGRSTLIYSVVHLGRCGMVRASCLGWPNLP